MARNAQIVGDFVFKLAIVISTSETSEFQARKHATILKLHNLGWFNSIMDKNLDEVDSI